MDVQASLDDAAALAALVQALAARALESPPPREQPHAEAIAESSFRASRDGIDATILHDGALAPARATSRARRSSRCAAMPASSAPTRRARGHRAHPARGRRRRAPARDRRARRHGGGADRLVRETQGAPMAELILGPMLRYLDERRRPSGSRPTGPARSRCWAGGAHVLRRGPPLRDRADHRPRARRDVSVRGARSTASGAGREADSEFPPSAIRTIDPERAAEDRVRIVPRRRAARAAVEPQPGRGRARPRGRRALRARAADDGARPRGVAAPAAVDRRPGLRGRGRARDARVHPLAARHEPAAGRGGAPTSRSTRACTGSRGATR